LNRCIYSRIEYLKKILLKIYSLGHILVIKIKTFFQNNFAQYMSNNFVTDQFNKIKLTGCALEKFSTTWQNKILKIVNGGLGETTQQDNFLVLYMHDIFATALRKFTKCTENSLHTTSGGKIVFKF